MEREEKEDVLLVAKGKGVDFSENGNPSSSRVIEGVDFREASNDLEGVRTSGGIGKTNNVAGEGNGIHLILGAWKGKKSFAEIVSKGTDWDYRKNIHPTMEPIDLEEKCLSFTKAQDSCGMDKEPIFDLNDEYEATLGSKFRWIIKGICKPFCPSLEAVHQVAMKILGMERKFQVEATNKWEILIHCSSEADYLKLLSKNLIQGEGFSIQLFRWLPGLNQREDFRKALGVKMGFS